MKRVHVLFCGMSKSYAKKIKEWVIKSGYLRYAESVHFTFGNYDPISSVKPDVLLIVSASGDFSDLFDSARQVPGQRIVIFPEEGVTTPSLQRMDNQHVNSIPFRGSLTRKATARLLAQMDTDPLVPQAA